MLAFFLLCVGTDIKVNGFVRKRKILKFIAICVCVLLILFENIFVYIRTYMYYMTLLNGNFKSKWRIWEFSAVHTNIRMLSNVYFCNLIFYLLIRRSFRASLRYPHLNAYPFLVEICDFNIASSDLPYMFGPSEFERVLSSNKYYI